MQVFCDGVALELHASQRSQVVQPYATRWEQLTRRYPIVVSKQRCIQGAVVPVSDTPETAQTLHKTPWNRLPSPFLAHRGRGSSIDMDDNASSRKRSALLSAIPTLSGMNDCALLAPHPFNYLSSSKVAAFVRGTEVHAVRKYGNAATRP